MEMKERREGGRKERKGLTERQGDICPGKGRRETSFGHYNAPGPITTTSNQDILGPVESRE